MINQFILCLNKYVQCVTVDVTWSLCPYGSCSGKKEFMPCFLALSVTYLLQSGCNCNNCLFPPPSEESGFSQVLSICLFPWPIWLYRSLRLEVLTFLRCFFSRFGTCTCIENGQHQARKNCNIKMFILIIL